ncbi:MAG: SGNH/GDSL hydrolase family protein [bacterium]
MNSERIRMLQNRFLADIERKTINGSTPLIVFIGDSITLGVPLKDPSHAYPDMFDSNISRASGGGAPYLARNVSGPGGNIEDEAKVFAALFDEYKPNIKLMVLGYCQNDIFTSIDEGRGIIGILDRLRESRKIGMDKSGDPMFYYWNRRQNRDMVRNAFKKIEDTARRHGTDVVIAIFPLFIDFGKRDYRYREIHERVSDAAEKEGLKVFDLLDVYGMFDASSFITDNDNTHPNPLGHKFAADALYKFISSNVLRDLPGIVDSGDFYEIEDSDRAAEFCGPLYRGENQAGRAACERVLAELAGNGKLLGNLKDREHFFINFEL